jgi:2-dehydro-3-deoxyphosphogluconate aldolase / (4S)-4-hydroxy-2-oxoglutarate aldolase
MHKKEKIIQAIVQQGLLPLYYHPDEETSAQVLEVLYSSGIRVVEYTNRGKSALKNFKYLRKITDKNFPGLILGLGTVMDSKTVLKAVGMGADFLVSPGYSKEIARLTDDENILWIPGCITPTELMQLTASGPGLVKLFPANMIGPAYIKTMKEVFPDLFFMPTGGVDMGNLEDWFQAGVSAVGIGGNLISKLIMEKKDWKLLKTNTIKLMNLIAAVRKSSV